MIRKATFSDIDQLAKLFNSYRVFYKQESDLDRAKSFLRARFELNESTIFLKEIEQEKEIVAFVQLYPSFSSISMKHIWILNDLFTDENHRGKGYARELLNKSVEVGKESGLRYLTLTTANDNFSAQRLYKDNGWKIEEDYMAFNFDLMKNQ